MVLEQVKGKVAEQHNDTIHILADNMVKKKT